MSTTIPTEFIGIPTITPEKIDLFKDWYQGALGDMDKSGDVDDNCYYTGYSDAFSDVLTVLYDNVVEPVVKVTKTTKIMNKKPVFFIIGVVIVVIIADGRLPRKAKSIFDKKFPIEPIIRY